MNFGDLLFALNCDRLKNEIRKIEKINKRIVQSKNGIYFNEICPKEGLHPKFSNIYIYILRHFSNGLTLIKVNFSIWRKDFLNS